MSMEELRQELRMHESRLIDKALEIVNKAEIILINSIDAETGHPRAVPVVKSRNDRLKEIIFSTLKSSHKVKNFQKDPSLVSVTIYDKDSTIVLYGAVEVYTEVEDLKLYWMDSMKGDFFKDGPQSENLAIIKFIPKKISALIEFKPLEETLI